MPRHDDSLSCVSLQQTKERGGRDFLLRGERAPFLPVPFRQMVLGPAQSFVQMTEIARVGRSVAGDQVVPRRFDLVRTNSFEERVAGVWHMAIQTVRSGRT